MSQQTKEKLAEAIAEFMEEKDDHPAVKKIGKAFRDDLELIHDRDIIMQLAKGCENHSKRAIKAVARFLQAHIRYNKTTKTLAAEILHELTDMGNTKPSNNQSHSKAHKSGIIELIGMAFLQKDQPVLHETLGQQWVEETYITFIQKIGMNEDILYSLADWHLDIACDCKNTMSAKTAIAIFTNVSRLNEILEEQGSDAVRIPDYLTGYDETKKHTNL